MITNNHHSLAPVTLQASHLKIVIHYILQKQVTFFAIEISPGNSRRKSETWLGSRISIGVGGCDDNGTGRGCWGDDGCHLGDGG